MKYVVLKGCAGLGNRLITAMKAIQYAKITDRCLFIDWSDGLLGPKGINIFDEYFQIVDKEIKLLNTNDKSKNILLYILKKGASSYPYSLNEKDINESLYDCFYCNDTLISKKVPLYRAIISFLFKYKLGMLLGLQCWIRKPKTGVGYKKMLLNINGDDCFCLGGSLKRNMKEDIVLFADFRPLCNMSEFNTTIRLRDTYRKRFEKFAKENGLNNAIGIHVRYTDKKPKRKLVCLINIIERIMLNDENMKLFLSTDNLDIQNMFKTKYNDRVIIYPKYLPENSIIGLHKWAEINVSQNQKKIMFEESLADMYLLSMCKYLFWQGNSSFSYISKLLKDEKSTTVNWLGWLR